MLALDDPSWAELKHAYGPASDIPGLLRTLTASPEPTQSSEEEPWFSIWSALCHQGDVYTASYAAVPHIVEIALRISGPIDFSFLQLPSAVEIARNSGRGPALPADLAEAYSSAIASLPILVSRHRHESWDRSMRLSAEAAIAVARGDIAAAEAMLDPDDA
ncbi:MAG TPA: hypothetical protein VMG08_07360 [Allosphingosinicella sp.]|nr:hypothetical protein [Allosphingosinicella sp.]